MKLKKITAGLVVCTVAIVSAVSANAFTGSSAGQWGSDVGVEYNYNSDGTLVIRGTDGTEDITSVCDSTLASDISNIIIDNVDSVGTNTYIFDANARYIDSFYINATNVGKITNQGTVPNYTTIVFGNDVRTVGSHAFGEAKYSATNQLKVVIPSTVTSLADDWIELYKGNITVVCEYGSEAYNWALSKQNISNVTVNIELADYTAYSNVIIDNTQQYAIVVPETISFSWSNLGWECDTFLGIIGTLPDGVSLTVKTDDTFTVLGDTVASLETVKVSTEDVNTVKSNQMLITTISKDVLANATDTIEVNTETKTGYKIDYNCITESEKLMKQTYNGAMKFLVAE